MLGHKVRDEEGGEGRDICAIWKMKQSQSGPGQRHQAGERISLIYILLQLSSEPTKDDSQVFGPGHARSAVYFLPVGYLLTDAFKEKI